MVSGERANVDLDKVEVIVRWPKPSNIKVLIGFLGFTNCHMRFIKGYALYQAH
jgi:hypothetical protein